MPGPIVLTVGLTDFVWGLTVSKHVTKSLD